MDNIKIIFEKYQNKIINIILIGLVGIVCFSLGKYSNIEREVPINIHADSSEENIAQKEEVLSNDESVENEILGKYVGSAQGSVFYLATQAKIVEIGEDNLIWFDSAEDAKEQGYQEVKSLSDVENDDLSENSNVEAGKYVASKNGTKYYLPSCSGVNRIKEENRVYFDSIEEARAAGLSPAANCPGLE